MNDAPVKFTAKCQRCGLGYETIVGAGVTAAQFATTWDAIHTCKPAGSLAGWVTSRVWPPVNR